MAFVIRGSSVFFAALGFAGVVLSCTTGNLVPLSGANALYYADVGSSADFTFQTYYFDADCTQQLQIALQDPNGVQTNCQVTQEPGAGNWAWTTCGPMSSFINGQWTIYLYGNVYEFNQFQVTTSQSTVTVTPTVTITDTPTVWQTQTSTETDTETDTVTPDAITLPATVKTVTKTPHKVTATVTQTRTLTRTKHTYTVVPTVVTVPPKCDHSRPPVCKSIPKPHRFTRDLGFGDIRLDAAAIEAVAEVEKRSNDLVVRDDTVSTLQPPTTTTTLTAGLPTIVVEAAPVTSTETDTAYATNTVWTTLAPETVYSGKSVMVITAPTPTKTKTKHAVTTTAITKTRTFTYTITLTTPPSQAQITSCYRSGGHF